MRRPGWFSVGFLVSFPAALGAQALTPDQRDLGVCPAARPAIDGAGPNAGVANPAAARAALRDCAPGTVPTILATVMVLMAENDRAALRAEVNRAVAVAPADPYVIRMQCHVEFFLRENARAVDLCTQALARRPDWDQALHYRGVAQLNLGKVAEALGDLERALSRNPRLTLTWTNLYLAYRQAGRPEKAAEALVRAVELTPNDAPRLYSLTEILLELRRYAEAESTADRLLAQRRNAGDYNLRGRVRAEQRKWRPALADFEAAEAADPRAAHAIENQGVAHQALSGCSAALPYYQRATRTDSTFTSALWREFRCYEGRDGSYRLAVATLDALTRRDSTDTRAWVERVRYRADSTRAQRDSSIRELDRGIRLNATVAEAYEWRARLHTRNGDHALAAADLRRRVAMDPAAPLVLFVDLGKALEHSGQAREAIAVLTDADRRMQGFRTILGLRGMVRLRAGDVGGVRDLAEWIRNDKRVEGTVNARDAYEASRTGGIAPAQFDQALTELMREPTLAPAARYMRLSKLVHEGDRRRAYAEFQALEGAGEATRGKDLLARFVVLDVGASQAPVAFYVSSRPRVPGQACAAVLTIEPDGDIIFGSDRSYRWVSYDPNTRRLIIRSESIYIDLRDAARPLLTEEFLDLRNPGGPNIVQTERLQRC